MEIDGKSPLRYGAHSAPYGNTARMSSPSPGEGGRERAGEGAGG
jgi:hypothetical protein